MNGLTCREGADPLIWWSMKRTMIITEISVVLLLLLFALSGCGSGREKAGEATTGLTADEPTTGLTADEPTAGQQADDPTGQNTDDTPASPDTDEMPLSLDALQGHWVDVNGDTTLDFDGDQMTVRWRSYEDLYTVGVTGTDRYGTVFNAKDRNFMFEMMSELIWQGIPTVLCGRMRWRASLRSWMIPGICQKRSHRRSLRSSI